MAIYHVFGDTGGHYKQLRQGLEALGMDDKLKLPSDIIIIHCGDLIHKGPESNAIVSMVDEIMKRNPGQWVQLAGNHETQYFGGPAFWRDNKITTETVETLQQWYLTKAMNFAYGIQAGAEIHDLVVSKRGFATPQKPILLTHAGVSKEFWQERLDSEENVIAVAEKINNLPLPLVSFPGIMLDGGMHASINPVGPVWAHSVHEVWASWKGYSLEEDNEEYLPFIQIHGHTSPYDFSRKQWWGNTYMWFRQKSRVNEMRKTLTTSIGDSIHVAIDPSYEKTASDEYQPALKITI